MAVKRYSYKKGDAGLVYLAYLNGIMTVVTVLLVFSFIDSLHYSNYLISIFLFLAAAFIGVITYENLRYIYLEVSKK